MFTAVLLVIHLFIAAALIGVVLLQKSEGGALGMGGGGMSGFMTGRSTANLLTRATALLAAAFFATSIVLAWLAGNASGPRSVIPTNAAAPAAPAQQAPASPAAPAEPSAPLAK
jgi:preprotein translocase subunit SecG